MISSFELPVVRDFGSFRELISNFLLLRYSLGGQRPRLGRSFGQHHKVVRSRAAPARLVGGGSGFFGLEGVLW